MTESGTGQLPAQVTDLVLIQNIVAHPEGLPSLRELSYANPSMSENTIQDRLGDLREKGLVEKVQLPDDEQTAGLPDTFYGLPESARELLERHGLLEGEETLREMHSMLEKTPEIEKYLNAPRPEVEYDGSS